MKRKKKRITKWTPLQKVDAQELARVNGILTKHGCPPENEIWLNDLYQVNVRFIPEMGMKHLSIKRRNKHPVHDWRHLQRIKNEIVGEECEALEIYPAESRLVDTANQYHLWAFTDPSYRIPCGFNYGRVVMDAGAGLDGSKQRAFGDGDKPKDMTTYKEVKKN
jgi:hypothetical protein